MHIYIICLDSVIDRKRRKTKTLLQKKSITMKLKIIVRKLSGVYLFSLLRSLSQYSFVCVSQHFSLRDVMRFNGSALTVLRQKCNGDREIFLLIIQSVWDYFNAFSNMFCLLLTLHWFTIPPNMHIYYA